MSRQEESLNTENRNEYSVNRIYRKGCLAHPTFPPFKGETTMNFELKIELL